MKAAQPSTRASQEAAPSRNYNCSWGTPDEILDLARAVLGEIDFDPFSSATMNERVGAKRFLDGGAAGDGFVENWGGRVLCNPPGPGANVRRAWAKAMEQRAGCNGMIWVSFNLEDLRRLQTPGLISPLSSHFAYRRMVPRKRLHFVGAGDHPRYANAIIWIPPVQAWAKHYIEQEERWHNAAPLFGEVF